MCLRDKEKSRLQATEMRILRNVVGVTRMDHIRNEIRHRLQQRSIVDVVRERRRVKVMEKPESLVERVMAGEIEGRQLRGRPRKLRGDVFQCKEDYIIITPYKDINTYSRTLNLD